MLLRNLLLSVSVATGVLVPVLPAWAGHICVVQEVEGESGELVLIEVCDPHDDEQPSPPPADSDEPAVTCNPRESFDAGVGQPTPREDGSWWVAWPYDCSDGTTQLRSRCVAACPEGVSEVDIATIPGLRLEALARIDPPLPGVRHSFDQPAANGDVRAIVLAETWWWGQNSYEPVTAQESDGPLWVEVTATPGELIIDPGDGSDPFSCPGPGVAFNHGQSYYQQVPGEPRGACVHVYEQVFDQVTATMTVAWEVTWQGYAPSAGTVGGALDPIVRQEQVSFPVRELQSVIVYSDGAD